MACMDDWDTGSFLDKTFPPRGPRMRKSYADRLHQHSHPLVKRLFAIMEEKQSNLGFSCDNCVDLHYLKERLEKLGPHIVVLKIQSHMVEGRGKREQTYLRLLSKKHNFLIFEDRKFYDFDKSTLSELYHMLGWADFISVTAFAGEGCVANLAKIINKANYNVGLMLLAESALYRSFANGRYGGYTQECVRLAHKFPISVLGFIALGKPTADDETDFLTFATNIDLSRKSDGWVMKCQTPEEAIREGVDVIFVGNELNGPMVEWLDKVPVDLTETVIRYKAEGWRAYEKMLLWGRSKPVLEQPQLVTGPLALSITEMTLFQGQAMLDNVHEEESTFDQIREEEQSERKPEESEIDIGLVGESTLHSESPILDEELSVEDVGMLMDAETLS